MFLILFFQIGYDVHLLNSLCLVVVYLGFHFHQLLLNNELHLLEIPDLLFVLQLYLLLFIVQFLVLCFEVADLSGFIVDVV